jgi:hypothetical protein
MDYTALILNAFFLKGSYPPILAVEAIDTVSWEPKRRHIAQLNPPYQRLSPVPLYLLPHRLPGRSKV